MILMIGPRKTCKIIRIHNVLDWYILPEREPMLVVNCVDGEEQKIKAQLEEEAGVKMILHSKGSVSFRISELKKDDSTVVRFGIQF